MTSACCVAKATPSASVHSICSAIISTTCGKATSALTLGSQGSGSSAWTSASPLQLRMAVILQPLRGFGDLLRIGRRHQHLRQQLIGVERDRRDQLVDLLPRVMRRPGIGGLVERGRRLPAGRRLRSRRLRQRQGRDQQEGQCLRQNPKPKRYHLGTSVFIAVFLGRVPLARHATPSDASAQTALSRSWRFPSGQQTPIARQPIPQDRHSFG